MPYVDPQSVSNPTTGQPIIAAWGDAARDATQYLSGGFPHCSVYASAAQSVSNGTETDLTADSENSDIGGMHSTSSNTARVTIPAGEGGLYVVSAVVSFAAGTTGYRVVVFRVNNTTNYDVFNIGANPVGGQVTTLTGLRSFVFNAADYVTARVYHTQGASLNVTLLDFSVRWVATA